MLLLAHLPVWESWCEQMNEKSEAEAVSFPPERVHTSNLVHFLGDARYSNIAMRQPLSAENRTAFLSFCGCRRFVAIIRRRAAVRASHHAAPHLRNRGTAGWLNGWMDGWADSVDTVPPSTVGSSSALRLIVSQMNALMNPHYITRLVCEERRGEERGRRQAGRRVVYCTYRGGDRPRRVYRGIPRLLIQTKPNPAFTSD